jgi:3-phenylpropionate/trans-cinnamate dioxygenase ferredoxin reductase component
MTSHPTNVVIIGAGECGTRAALALREAGYHGRLALIGEEPSQPYERPVLSKSVLTSDDAKLPADICTVGQLTGLDIAFEPGTAAAQIDRDAAEVVLADGRRRPYDRLLIATGARARIPAVEGADAALTLRSLADAMRLRDRLTAGASVVVIGGGFIGLEVAASAAARGCAVTVVEFSHQLMSRIVPALVAAEMHVRHALAGVEILYGVGVERIDVDGTSHRVVLTSGAVLVCDVVVSGVGAVPNTELAGASGLALHNGIAVDEQLRTADPLIFAAGDCCSFPHPLYRGIRVRLEAWRNALEQAAVVASNMLGGDAVCDSVPWFWSDQYELTIQIAGLHACAVRDVVRRRDDGVDLRFGLDYDGRLVSASGISEGSAIGRDIRLAEMLIAARATPSVTDLADPAIGLRSLLPKP